MSDTRASVDTPTQATDTPGCCRVGAASENAAVAPDGLDDLESAFLGAGLPAAAGLELQRAAESNDDDLKARVHLERALAIAPAHPATHIALYRFHFYRRQLAEALAVGRRCLCLAADLNGLPQDWRRVERNQAAFGEFKLLPRFYLFTLKACAYLCLRLGEFGEGAEMIDRLLSLDPADRVNGSVLKSVLDRRGRNDDDDE